MTSQQCEAAGPLLPMPPLTPEALRTAVAQILPSRLRELNEHLARAATNSQQTSSIGPLLAFTEHWGTVVNIARWPDRARRFHACEERSTDPTVGPSEARAAASELAQILRTAAEEITE